MARFLVEIDGKRYAVEAANQKAAASAVRTMLAADAAAAPAAPRRTGNDVGNTLRTGLGQGLGFGFGDEIEAGVRSLFSDRSYGDIRGDISDEIDAFRSRNPGLAYGSEIAGALGPTLAAAVATPFTGGGAGAGAAAGAGRIAMAGNKLRQLATPALRPVAQPIAKASKAVDAVLPTGPIKRAATVGAVQGGISGAGYADGGLEDRAGGAAVGAGLGAAIPGLGAAVLPRLSDVSKKAIQSGVNMTPGQAFGGIYNKIEQLGTSTLSGGAITGRRIAADADYFPVRVNKALAGVGKQLDDPNAAPNQIMEQLLDKTSEAYDDAAKLMSVKGEGAIIVNKAARDALAGMDDTLVEQVVRTMNVAASRLPKPKGDALRAAMNQLELGVKPRLTAVDLSGDEILMIKNLLRQQARLVGRNNNHALRGAYERLQRGIVNEAGRSSGGKAAAALGRADALYRDVAGVIGPAMRKSRIDRAPRIADYGRESAKNQTKYGRKQAMLDQALDDTALSELTANTVANSGSIDRGTLMALVGGLGTGFINPMFLTAQLAGVPYMTPQTTAMLRQGLLAPGRITQALGGRFGGMIGGANAQE